MSPSGRRLNQQAVYFSEINFYLRPVKRLLKIFVLALGGIGLLLAIATSWNLHLSTNNPEGPLAGSNYLPTDPVLLFLFKILHLN